MTEQADGAVVLKSSISFFLYSMMKTPLTISGGTPVLPNESDCSEEILGGGWRRLVLLYREAVFSRGFPVSHTYETCIELFVSQVVFWADCGFSLYE